MYYRKRARDKRAGAENDTNDVKSEGIELKNTFQHLWDSNPEQYPF